MKQEMIKQLLEKYWKCETSQEEEAILRTYFSGENISEDLMQYRSLFCWKKAQSQIKADKKLKQGFDKPFTYRFYPILKVAASILLIFTIGIGAYTHYQQQKVMDRIFSETYSDPEEALKETGNIITKVSAALRMVPDSLIKREEMADSLSITPLDRTIELDSTIE